MTLGRLAILAWLAVYALAALTYEATWIDPLDGTRCDTYRAGSHEVNLCTVPHD